MQRPWIQPALLRLFNKETTVGDLMDLCEENYGLLMRITPGLEQYQGKVCSCLPGHMDLYLEVQEQSVYTSLIHLTYYFQHHEGQSPDPDVLLRVYHDARQVEVLDLSQNALPMDKLYEAPGLFNKWRVNLFLSKWLAFCVRQGHIFDDCVQDIRKKDDSLASLFDIT